MADHLHKKSGYISTFWHVLFAPFIQLFTRIFPFAKEKNPPQNPSQNQHQSQHQSQHQHQHQQSSSSLLPPPQQPETQQPPPPLTSSSPSSSPSPSPSHGTESSAAHHLPDPDPGPDTDSDLATLHQHDHRDQHHHHHHLDSISQDDPMAAAKKRGGQKRGGGGVKANGSKSTAAAATTPASGDQSNIKPASQTKPNATSNTFAPAGVTPLANQRDTKHQPDGPKPTASRRGSRGGRNRGRSSPTRQLVENTNANIVNGTKGNNASASCNGFTPAVPATQQTVQNAQSTTTNINTSTTTTLRPLAPADSRAEPQKPGTRSQVATKTATATTKPTNDENASPQDPQVEHVRTVVDRLTLDESPASEQVPERGLTKATTAAETSALPVPLVVAIPLPGKSAPPKLATPGPSTPILPGLIEPKTEEEQAEREYHLKYMREALDMGQLALNTNETPVGCVLVYHGRTIAKGMNATNVTRNGTRHAEFMALSALLSRREKGDVGDVNTNPALDDASWGDVDPRDGHIYPYGQKLHPAPVVDRSIISECILYVTVEPCVMCASLLRQLGIKRVYFGAVNDKFGGTGGVFRIHMNSKPVVKPSGRPYQNGYGPPDVDRISKGRVNSAPREDDDGDGGNVESGFPAEGGFLRDDAVSLLRRFYVQENGRAPQPRKKEGRAARLFAMENQAKTGCPNGSTSEFSDTATLPDTPVDPEPTAEDREMIESLAKPATTAPDAKLE